MVVYCVCYNLHLKYVDKDAGPTPMCDQYMQGFDVRNPESKAHHILTRNNWDPGKLRMSPLSPSLISKRPLGEYYFDVPPNHTVSHDV